MASLQFLVDDLAAVVCEVGSGAEVLPLGGEHNGPRRVGGIDELVGVRKVVDHLEAKEVVGRTLDLNEGDVGVVDGY